MVNEELAKDYIKRVKIRFNILKNFLKEEDYADIISESQEIVELIQKAILIKIGIEPPKWHDIIDILEKYLDKVPKVFSQKIDYFKKECKWLRKQREISFYGDMDFLPLKSFTKEDADRAIKLANEFIKVSNKFYGKSKI